MTGLLVMVGSDHLGLLVGGDSTQFVLQLLGVGFGIAFAFVGTLILGFIVDMILGLRVSEKQETLGLDITEHGEVGISLR